MTATSPRIATLTLNPALDLTVRADGWRRGEVNLGQHLHWAAGGKGVNVASFLADRGLAVTATGLLGGENPEPFETLFRTKGIRDAFVRVPGATRVGVKLVDGAAQETTDINLPGLAATPEVLEELESRVFALAADTTVHAALKAMRETRNHLAVVHDSGAVVGVVTLSDVLRRLFPGPTAAAA